MERAYLSIRATCYASAIRERRATCCIEARRTGVKVSLIGMGGAHLSRQPLDEARRSKLSRALDPGSTFSIMLGLRSRQQREVDGPGLSQAGYRHKAFLMTKLAVDPRSGEVTARRIARSAQDRSYRSRPVSRDSCASTIRIGVLRRTGANRALVAARRPARCAQFGFTVNKDPRVTSTCSSREARRVAFDTVQMPLNVMDATFAASRTWWFRRDPQGIGVSDEVDADGVILKSGAPVTAIDCLHYR